MLRGFASTFREEHKHGLYKKKKRIGVSEKKEESILFAISLYRVTVLDKKFFDIRLAFNVLKN